MGERRIHQISPAFDYQRLAPAQASTARRHRVKDVPAPVRVRNFEEAVMGLTADEAHEEACRCLRCDVKTAANA